MKIVSKNTKGSAIFTVVCVMSILIMASMFTFMMIGYAQKRSIVNYRNSQSYITAKSFLDTCVTAANNGPGSPTPDANLIDATEGNKLCKELWNLTGSAPTPIAFNNGLGNVTLEAQLIKDDIVMNDSGYDPGLTAVERTIKLIVTAKSGVKDATGNYNGEESEATITQEIKIKRNEKTTTNPNSSPGNRWNSAAKGIDGLSFGTSSRFYGGSSVLKTGNNYAGFAGASGSIYADGDVSTKDSGNDGGTYKLNSGNSIATKGDFIINNNMSFTSTAGSNPSKMPFIYAGGKFKNENQATVGTADNPVALLCNGADINNIPIYGPLYSNGDVKITGNDGVYKAKNAYVNGNLSFTGGIGMNINSSNVAQKFGSQQICYTGTLTLDGKTLDQFDAKTKEALEKVFVKTDEATMGLSFNDNDAKLETGMNIVTPDNGVYDFATRQSNYGDLLSDVDKGTAKTTEDILKDDKIDFSGVLGNAATTPPGGSTITSDTKLSAGQYDNIVIDASAGDVKLVLEGGNYKGNITVIGKNKVQIYTNGDVNMDGFELVSDSIKKANEIVTGDDALNAAMNPPKTLTPAPNIYMYLKSGTNMNVKAGTPSLISAYILGTGAGTKFSTDPADGTSKNIKVIDSGTESNGKICVIGSIIANEIDMKQGTGIVYVNPTAGASPPSNPPPGGTPTKTYNYRCISSGGKYLNY